MSYTAVIYSLGVLGVVFLAVAGFVQVVRWGFRVCAEMLDGAAEDVK